MNLNFEVAGQPNRFIQKELATIKVTAAERPPVRTQAAFVDSSVPEMCSESMLNTQHVHHAGQSACRIQASMTRSASRSGLTTRLTSAMQIWRNSMCPSRHWTTTG